MSYLWPSPPPGRRGPPRHSGVGPCDPCPAPMTCHAWPGAPLRWRPRMARRRRAWLTGSRRPGCRPVLGGNRPAPQATHQHSRQPGLFCQVWGQGSLSSFSCLCASSSGLPQSRGGRPGRPGDCGSSHYQHWAVNPTTDQAGLKTQESRRRGRQRAGAQARARAVILPETAPHHSDPAVAADRQPPPFWANHSSTRQAMSEPRTAPAFQLTWQ